MAKKRSQMSDVSSSMPGWLASALGRIALMPMPALLTSASIWPKRSRAISIACAQLVSVLRSASIGQRRSVLSHKLLRRSSDAASRSTAATQWPSRRSARVITRPMPPAAPVSNTMRLRDGMWTSNGSVRLAIRQAQRKDRTVAPPIMRASLRKMARPSPGATVAATARASQWCCHRQRRDACPSRQAAGW
jgi:hypothetical protein